MANKQSSGISFFGLLTILFIGLKLLNKIDWSWFWVLSPLFLPLTIIVMCVIIWGIIEAYQKTKKVQRAKKEFEKIQSKNPNWNTKYNEVLATQNKIEILKKK